MPPILPLLLLLALSAIVGMRYALYPTFHDVQFRLDKRWTPQRRGVGIAAKCDPEPRLYRDLEADFRVNSSLGMMRTKLDLFFQQNPEVANHPDYRTGGISLSSLRRSLERWRASYDWRARLGKFERNMGEQYVICVNGLRIHYFHRRAQVANRKKTPTILLLHGWPGSFTEFQNVVPLLVAKGYDVVTPSLPNFGFSDKAEELGYNFLDAAVTFAEMMGRVVATESGYVCQGGDYGSLICTAMAQLANRDPARVKGLQAVHLNMAVVLMPPLSQGATLSYFIKAYVYSPDEKDRTERLGPTLPEFFLRVLRETGYYHEQATKPNTVGMGLNDSPVFLASWILEKFAVWGDEAYPDEDELLDDLTVYWLSQSGVSSCSYYQNMMEDWRGALTSARAETGALISFAVVDAPKEIFRIPPSWLPAKYNNLARHTVFKRGGHFLAMENPEGLTRDLIDFIEADLKL